MNFRMLRFVKKLVWLSGLIIGCQSAFGFALLGPIPNNQDVYQVPAIGYAESGFTLNGTTVITTAGIYSAPGIFNPTFGFATGLSDDMGTPKQIGEGYRRNTPVMYYSFDASFLGFFGPDGAAEVDKAMAMYNSLTNVSSYSPDLSEFPLDSRRQNIRAATASLLDIRSVTLGLMTEQLGFWQPVRWVWALHGRVHLTGTGIPPCPLFMVYSIDKRNLDILSSDTTDYQYSSYVNGVLYSYLITEGCTTTPLLADAVEVPVDPLSSPYSAVADYTSLFYNGLTPGSFYTSLTRDDVGGLRYLIRSNNRAIETAGARTTGFVTNNSPTAIQTQDLNLFAAQARTNDAAGLTALYPGLLITSSTNVFGLLITTNITETLVNSPFDPAGAPPSHALFTTNFTTNFFNFFHHTFGNVVINIFSTRGFVATVTLGLTNSPFSPAGTPPTITTNVKPALVNGIFGDFLILPTNFCSALILSNFFTTVIATTNPPTAIVSGVTNVAITFIPGSVSFFTNHVVIYLPVTCPVDMQARFEGVERLRFIRRDYDSLLNQAWEPVTNDYTLNELTNSMIVSRHIRRVVPKPDFLFTAADLGFSTSVTYSNTVAGATETLNLTVAPGVGKSDVIRTINFNQTARPGNNAGPGTIESPFILPTLMIYNKMGPLYFNSTAFGLVNTNAGVTIGEPQQTPLLALSWGSFDGTTNSPEVYPNGHSIEELESLVIGPAITTTSLPNASIGVNYSAQFSATGGQPPYTWSLSPGSLGLPAGLNLGSDGSITGTPNGPAGIYDFTVR